MGCAEGVQCLVVIEAVAVHGVCGAFPRVFFLSVAFVYHGKGV